MVAALGRTMEAQSGINMLGIKVASKFRQGEFAKALLTGLVSDIATIGPDERFIARQIPGTGLFEGAVLDSLWEADFM